MGVTITPEFMAALKRTITYRVPEPPQAWREHRINDRGVMVQAVTAPCPGLMQSRTMHQVDPALLPPLIEKMIEAGAPEWINDATVRRGDGATVVFVQSYDRAALFAGGG